MAIIQLMAAAAGGEPPYIDFIVVGGGQGGSVGIDVVGAAGYGGTVLSVASKTISAGATVTFQIGGGGAGAPRGTNAASPGSPGGNSSLSMPTHGTFTAAGGSNSNNNSASVSTWAGTFGGRGTGLDGAGGTGGLTCWWDSVGYPTLCAGGPAGPGQSGRPGIVYIRTPISQPVASSYPNASVSTTATHRIYTYTSGGSITF